MKIAMFYDLGPLDDFTNTGGIESHILSLLREFASYGIECNFFTGSIPLTRKRISKNGVQVIRLNFPGLKQAWNPYNLKFKRQFFFLLGTAFKGLVKIKAFRETDIFHGHIYSSGIAALIAARMHRRKAINTIHGSYYDHWFELADREEIAIAYRTFEKLLSKELASLCDLQIHTDHYFANKVRSFGAPTEKIITIHNGVDDKIFHPQVDPSSSLLQLVRMNSRPLLITVRRLVPKNGIHHLIDACKILAKKLQFTLVVCGEGPQKPFLEARVKSLKLNDNILFLGRVPNKTVPSLLKAADLVVIPSIVEASSISLIEALLVKIPCVVTRIPGISEIVDDSLVEFCKPSSPQSLACSIIRSLDHPSRAKQKTERAYRHAKNHLTISKSAKNHIKAYEKVL